MDLRRNPGIPSVADPFPAIVVEDPVGDSQNDPLRVDFDHQFKLEFHGLTVTSDAGLLANREHDDAPTLTTAVAAAWPVATGMRIGVRLAAFVKSIRSSSAIAVGCCGAPLGSFSMTQRSRSACVGRSGPFRTQPKSHSGG